MTELTAQMFEENNLPFNTDMEYGKMHNPNLRLGILQYDLKLHFRAGSIDGQSHQRFALDCTSK